LAPADAVLARLAKNLLVGDRPRDTGNRNRQNEENRDLHAETHFASLLISVCDHWTWVSSRTVTIWLAWRSDDDRCNYRAQSGRQARTSVPRIPGREVSVCPHRACFRPCTETRCPAE